MKTLEHYRAMLGICRQRAQMDGEDVSFWLKEAALLEQLLTNANRREQLKIEGQSKPRKQGPGEKRKSPTL
jgi:hypothetical protein